MEMRNCPRCKRVFNYIGGIPLCPNCKEEDEKDFERVKDYLRENRGAKLHEVAETLEISIEKIKRFLKEGRLELAPGEVTGLECESCGAQITTGRYCKNCAEKLENKFETTSKDIRSRSSQSSSDSLMRFLRNEEK